MSNYNRLYQITNTFWELPSALLLFILLFLASCVDYKQMPYLQETNNQTYKILYDSLKPHRIKKGDLLHIDLKSMESSVTDMLEGGSSSGLGQIQPNNASVFLKGFTVDTDGQIDLPLVGTYTAEGKTLKIAGEEIESLLKDYIKYIEVSVKLANFRVTVLGEVNRTGVQYVYDERYNLFQAIANAGDLTDFANRKKIKIIRETLEGLETAGLDITNPKVLESPYFFLQSGDMIYIEPAKARGFAANSRPVTVGVSVLSFVALILNIITR